MKKLVLGLLILAAVGGTAFSFDPTTFPEPIDKASILISPTFGFGFFEYSGLGVTVTAAVDVALPIPFALAVGGEVGIAFAPGWIDSSLITVPILARFSWHPNFEVRGLDPYVTLKLGYNIAVTEYFKGGFSYGANVGMRYFFTNNIGVFAELGYDRLALKYDWGEDWGWLGGYTYTWTSYIYTWFHAGVTIKVGGQPTQRRGRTTGGSSSSRSSGDFMLVNADALNVRSGPGADHAAVGMVERNNRVEVLERSGQWWKIKYGNVEGYVNSSFLTPAAQG